MNILLVAGKLLPESLTLNAWLQIGTAFENHKLEQFVSYWGKQLLGNNSQT